MMTGRKAEQTGAVVVVAVRAAARDISRAAVVWALTHVVQHGDTVLLLALNHYDSSGGNTGRKNKLFWSFPFFAGGCASAHRAVLNQTSDTSEMCSQMMLKLHDVYDPTKVNLKVKVLSPSSSSVATESKRAQATWVVLDRELKHEEKRCMEQLQCNIVVMKRSSRPKVLRLNLAASPEEQKESPSSSSTLQQAPAVPDSTTASSVGKAETTGDVAKETSARGPPPAVAATPLTPSNGSSQDPDSETAFGSTDVGASSSVSSSDPATSPFCASSSSSSSANTTNYISLMNLKEAAANDNSSSTQHQPSDNSIIVSDSQSGTSTPPAASSSSSLQPWMADVLEGGGGGPAVPPPSGLVANRRPRRTPTADALLEKISRLDLLTEISAIRSRSDLNFRGRNVRDVISLSRRAPPGPPPLCSICRHKTPVFGKPPRWFSYAELELATGGFSRANFLAEGGYGSVHRGVLPDGQAIAVKQHKLASSQGDVEFCSEVEVLSCAQHRNVVMLIGFCVEDKRRLLVYEYICNGSLDSHLYGRNNETLEWASRQKIAVGAARGLRYLHEECRVGCIIHRDMRPNNILVTHDYEPLVGDFGLARWQPDGDMGVETRVIGTFGYLAPEYAQSGQITEKADVYSFGVVLVELVTGRKAVDINRPKGQQFLTEWARPLLEDYAIDELIDPRLGRQFSENEVYCMLHAANLCIRRDPHSRPRMSHVLRILEGEMVVDAGGISTPSSDAGSRSWRLPHGSPVVQHDDSQRFDEGKHSYETATSAWDRDRQSSSHRY